MEFHCRHGCSVRSVWSTQCHWMTAASTSEVGVCALNSSSRGVLPAPLYQRSKRP